MSGWMRCWTGPPDQSFDNFVASRPNVPDKVRRTIYLQPLCDPADFEAVPFPQGPWPSWQALETAVREFYFPLGVVTLPAMAMDQLSPKPKSRKNSYGKQYHAGQVLDALMKQSLPRNAFCTPAVTMCDLYPREEWNFVYGLASLKQRLVFLLLSATSPKET
mmetsp:Transcript_44768/g.119825  ORF Transcript_44768/g.119825 Transcript_44768/m.119825 type:complete len:162 (+) Transcript_44768:120-605(+)